MPLSFWQVSIEISNLVAGLAHEVAQAGPAWPPTVILPHLNRLSAGWMVGRNRAVILEPLGIKACQATILISSRSHLGEVAANKGMPIKVLHRNEARCNGLLMVM